MRRPLTIALIAALLCLAAALAWIVVEARAVGAAPLARPVLVLSRASESVWWIEGDETGLADACLETDLFNAFRVTGPLLANGYSFCAPGEGTAARRTLIAEGPCRVVTWRGEVIERRTCVFLAVVR